MGRGFFPSSTLHKKAPPPLVPRCGRCGLYKTCRSPKMPHSGEGRRRILIVGEAPGRNEDDKGRQFVGESGQYLERALAGLGVDMRRDCWLHNAIVCRPEDNATPTDAQVQDCRPNLFRVLRETKPEVIIPLGNRAVYGLIGQLWKEDVGPISRWVGWQIPGKEPNAWICPNYHPSFCVRQEDPVLDLLFRQYLEAALAKEGRPWDAVPDYSHAVTVITDPADAVKAISMFCDEDQLVAFDYETEGLKPDNADLRAVCASISDGEGTVAFPLSGRGVLDAWRRFLRSPSRKIASNLKMEERWSLARFDTPVRNWAWDTVIAAHQINNTPGVAGLKFQQFVLLGEVVHDDHIKPFLGAATSNSRNRVREIDLRQLLVYCGLDSLYEILVARRQAEILGVGL